jgi:hypothetical protein
MTVTLGTLVTEELSPWHIAVGRIIGLGKWYCVIR